MEIMRVQDEHVADYAAAQIDAGSVIIYPTDTLYGLGADALSDSAVKHIYEIKGRDEGKPIHAIVSEMQMAARYAHVNESALKLAEAFLPGALTLILRKRDGIETGVAKGIDTFGIRIPDNSFCRELSERFGGPITTTSANRAGMLPMTTVAAIAEQLGDTALTVTLAVDAGELPKRLPSTVVDCSGDVPTILREGAIPAADIHRVLGA